MKTTTCSALLLAACLPLSVQAQEAAAPADAPLTPKIVCDEPIYDFGTMSNAGFIEHDYPIRNEGTLSLEIQNVHASCGCTAVKPSQNVIPPGGTAAISARLDLRGRTGFQQKTITVQCNDPATPSLILQLKGTATQILRAQPTTLFFGRVGPEAVRSRRFDVISERGPFQIVSTRTDNPGLILTAIEPAAGEDGSTRHFELALDPALPVGNVSGTAFVKTDMDDQPEISVAVAAYVTAAEAAAPALVPVSTP